MVPDKMELREEAKRYYRDQKNIENKWLDQFGCISAQGDYQRNRSCILEIFNMLDVVMEAVLDDFRSSHVMIAVEPDGHSAYYTFEGDAGDTIRFRKPTSFSARVIALRAIGYTLSDELFYGTRLLRNETTHGNKTIILQYMQLSYEDTLRAMLSMADALIQLKKLPEELRLPSFENLRIREGDRLQNGTYTIGPLIGEGGQSRVYYAEQERIGRKFAVKEMKPGTFSLEQVRHEYDVLSGIHHKQIPAVYDFFDENTTYYIVMDYIDGVSLEQYLGDPDSKVTETAKRAICLELMDILEDLHTAVSGIVFADLSPDNIMIDKHSHVHLIDFGISADANSRQVLKAATLGYSAPEVFLGGALDERSDIYSLGYIFRYLYTGLSPFDAQHEPTSNLVSDQRLAEAINRCTARNPKERFASIADLRSFLYGKTGTVSASSRRKWVVIAAAAGAVVLAAALIFYFAKHPETENTAELREASAVAENAAVSSGTGQIFNDYEKELTSFEDSGLTDHPMDWKDAALEAKMREITGIRDEEILLSDVWALPILDLENADISDISALSELTQLRELYLGHNNISDTSPLRALNSLCSLELEYNTLSAPDALDFLKDTGNISWLDLDHCGISDISPLSALQSLTSTALNGNMISDLTPLSDLKLLDYLDISTNAVQDLSPLSGLTGLIYLNAAENDISDLSALSELTALIRLDLRDNNISDISVLSKLSDLTDLDISLNPVADYSVLENLQLESVRK